MPGVGSFPLTTLHVNTDYRLWLCGLWQPSGCFKGSTCSENQRHTGPDGQGEFGAGVCACECACAWIFALLACGAHLCGLVLLCMHARKVCVCVSENDIRLITWPQLTSCSSCDPIYFHCRNQMSLLSLPKNLSVSVTCYTEDHQPTHTHTSTHMHGPTHILRILHYVDCTDCLRFCNVTG